MNFSSVRRINDSMENKCLKTIGRKGCEKLPKSLVFITLGITESLHLEKVNTMLHFVGLRKYKRLTFITD